MAGNQNLVAKIIINAQDNASGVFETLKNNLGKIASLTVFKSAFDDAAKFEVQLDKVAAKGGYTASEMEQLKQAATEIGVKFGMSGTQAAEGLEILAAAGLKSNDSIKALPNVLALAKTEAMSMEDAATLVSNAVSQMGLKFSDSQRIVDAYTKAANLSTVSSKDIGESMKVVGTSAHSAGLSIETTAAILDVFADKGIKGESAGTKLQNILAQLGDSSGEARKELSKMGINSSDLITVLDQLKNSGKDTKDVINAFGLVVGPGIKALLDKGVEGIKGYETEIKNATGFGAEAARKMGENFDGAKDRLIASLSNLKAKFAEPALEPLTKSFDFFTKSVSENTPEIVKVLTELSALYGLKLAKDAATFVQGMMAANAAKTAAKAATQQVVAAEQELIAAMAAGGTQTTRYQNAQAQLTAAMNEGGAATNSLAAKQSQLLTAQQAAQAATTRVTTAQTELNAALAAGGVEVSRYAQAQLAVNAAQANSQAATQRLTTAQADLNAEIAAGGVGSARAAVLQQELNVAKLAAQTADARLTAAQAELNAAMTAGGERTQRYATALTELQAAQTRASATTSTLEARTAALTAGTNNAAVSASRMEGAFNNAMAAFSGWTIGTMIGDFLAQFDKVKAAGSLIAEEVVILQEEFKSLFSGEYFTQDGQNKLETKIKEINKSFEEMRVAYWNATEESKAAATQQATNAETQKKAVEEQKKAVEEFNKLLIDKLKETTAAIDDRYKTENELIKTATNFEIESIKSATNSQQEKAELITQITKDSTQEQIDNLTKAAEEKQALTKQVYDDAIAKSVEGSATRKQYEQDYLDASKQINESLFASYKQTVDSMISAAQSHRDKALGFAQDILDAEQRKHDGILELERIGMNDTQLKASKKKEIADDIAKYKKLMADGEYEQALALSKKTEQLVLDLAKTEKTQSSEVRKLKEQYKQVIDQTEQATRGLQQSEENQAKQLEANAKSQVEKMEGVKVKIGEIQEKLNKEHLLKINNTSVDKTQEKVDKLKEPTESTHTVIPDTQAAEQAKQALTTPTFSTHYISTSYTDNGNGTASVGGRTVYHPTGSNYWGDRPQGYSIGGAIDFKRREGKLGGYGGGDTVPAMLEPGEFIMRKEAVAMYGTDFMAQINNTKVDSTLPAVKIPRGDDDVLLPIQKFQFGGLVNWWNEPIGSADRLKGALDSAKATEQMAQRELDFVQNDYNDMVSKGRSNPAYSVSQTQKINELNANVQAQKDKVTQAQKAYDDAVKKDSEQQKAFDEQRKAQEKIDVNVEAEKPQPQTTQIETKPTAPVTPISPKTLPIQNTTAPVPVISTPQIPDLYLYRQSVTLGGSDEIRNNDLYKQKEESFKLTDDEVGLEKLRYEREKLDLRGNQAALAQAEKNHQAKLAEIEKKAQEEIEKETYKQKEESFKLADDQVGLENLRYEQEQKDLAGNKEALAQAKKNHQAKLAEIEKKAQEKVEKETYKQKEEGFKLTDDQVGLETLRYEQEKQDLAGNKEALAQAEKNNKLRLAQIQAEKQQEKISRFKEFEQKVKAQQQEIAKKREQSKQAELEQRLESARLDGNEIEAEKIRYQQELSKIDQYDYRAGFLLKENHEKRLAQIRKEQSEKAQQEAEKLAQEKQREAEKQAAQTQSLKDQFLSKSVDPKTALRLEFNKQMQELGDNEIAKSFAREIYKQKLSELENGATVSSSNQTPQTNSQSNSNQVITIRFESGGRAAQGQFSQNDANAVVEILRNAAASGLPASFIR